MSEEKIYFGKFEIDKKQIFYNKNDILGIVNISPIVKDHVLVIPKSNKKNEYGDLNNKIDQFHKLEPLVAQNLYLAVHEIENAFVKNIEGINGFNIAMQDGRSAGQSVPHVHVHILPRKGNEFSPPDRVHTAIERGDMTPEGNNEEFQVEQMRIPPRRGEEGMAKMAAEAENYKQFFTTSSQQTGGMDNSLGEDSLGKDFDLNEKEQKDWDDWDPPGSGEKNRVRRSNNRRMLRYMYEGWKPNQQMTQAEANFERAQEAFIEIFEVEPTAVNVNNIMKKIHDKVEEGNDILNIIEDDEFLDSISRESSQQTGGSSGSYKFLIHEYQKDMEYFKNKKGGKKTKRRKIKKKVTKKNI